MANIFKDENDRVNEILKYQSAQIEHDTFCKLFNLDIDIIELVNTSHVTIHLYNTKANQLGFRMGQVCGSKWVETYHVVDINA